jgi:N-ATPase, AtpR subunit
MSVALAGFYFVSGGHWERLVTCLLGFVTARPAVTRLTGATANSDVHYSRSGDLLAARVSQTQRHHCVHVGADAYAGDRLKLVTRKLSMGLERSRWQNLLEIVVTGIDKQIEDVGLSHPEKYIGFLGTPASAP